jgi:hypothetical protein
MTKIFSIALLLVMAAHLIKPFNLPGLRRRRDFWKLALFGLGAVSLTAVLSHGG